MKAKALTKQQASRLMLAVDALLCNTEDPGKVPTKVLFASSKYVKELRDVYTDCIKSMYGIDFNPLFTVAAQPWWLKDHREKKGEESNVSQT